MGNAPHYLISYTKRFLLFYLNFTYMRAGIPDLNNLDPNIINFYMTRFTRLFISSNLMRFDILHHLDRQFEAAHLGIRAASRYGLKTPPQWMGNGHILLELFKFRLLDKKSFSSINTVLSDLETHYHHLLLALSAILYFTDAQAFAWHSLYALNRTCQSGFSAFSRYF